MPAITLPDGSSRQFDGPVTGTAVAMAIGPGLAKAALAMKLDGRLTDLSRVIEQDASELGRIAGELLFSRIAGNRRPVQRLVLPTRLVPRGSGELRA